MGGGAEVGAEGGDERGGAEVADVEGDALDRDAPGQAGKAGAVRDNGGGIVIGSELVAEKVEVALANLATASLGDYVDIRPGDARSTLRDLDGPADLALVDGWPSGPRPSLDLRVLQLIDPQLRPGALVVDDNGEADVIAFLTDPTNGYRSMTLPLGPLGAAVKAS